MVVLNVMLLRDEFINSNPSGYPPTGMMFEVTRKVKCYVGLAFRICGTINLWRTDGRAGGQGQTSQTKCSRLVFQKQGKCWPF